MRNNKPGIRVKVLYYFIILSLITGLCIGLVIVVNMVSSKMLYERYKDKPGYYFYSIDDTWILKSGFVKNESDTSLIQGNKDTYLPYTHKYWIVDTLDNDKIVEFVGVNRECWGYVKGYTLLKYIQKEPPPEELLYIKAKIVESLNTEDWLRIRRLKDKAEEPLGSIFGFYCPCEEEIPSLFLEKK